MGAISGLFFCRDEEGYVLDLGLGIVHLHHLLQCRAEVYCGISAYQGAINTNRKETKAVNREGRKQFSAALTLEIPDRVKCIATMRFCDFFSCNRTGRFTHWSLALVRWQAGVRDLKKHVPADHRPIKDHGAD
ncbi:MAG: hypothetical protein A3G25_00085 [Betaproteobacteria bacterium RIFCSPLOWO2_12_FULL_63_13]|nr:MAG: hypothetical protein A3G25_00085 [Betaproteobacteria bacterium RIFCSPLOWO2_12_FULL_63_13]